MNHYTSPGTPVRDRLWARTVVAETGCWEWQGHRGKDGYGRLYWQGKTWLTHRLAWETYFGPIPAGLQIDHLCKNRACWRPDHLDPVTARENTRRSESPAGLNAAKTVCHNGHPLEGANLHITKRGVRVCRRCRTLRVGAYLRGKRRWQRRMTGV